MLLLLLRVYAKEMSIKDEYTQKAFPADEKHAFGSYFRMQGLIGFFLYPAADYPR